MDLYAYAQIDDLESLVKANHIDIPRVRGYRLMRDEKYILQERINTLKSNCEFTVLKRLCASIPWWSTKPEYRVYDNYVSYLTERYYGENGRIRWDRIHGWKRKVLKFEIKKQKKKIQRQFDMWNKYVGRDDVLYIHSRMGGGNWKYFDTAEKIKLQNQPWFLDRVDDHYDGTYCDFYAKINKEVML